MDKRDNSPMDDIGFDEILRQSVSDIPPEDIISGVTPCGSSLRKILVGMALNAVTLNFFGLNYLLPTVGFLLMLIGSRRLKNENRWFRAFRAIVIAELGWYIPLLGINATVYQSDLSASILPRILSVVNISAFAALSVCLGKGIRAVQKKAGLEPHAGRAVLLTLWYGIVILLGLLQSGGVVIGIFSVGMIAVYFLLLRSLKKLAVELDEAGYTVRPPSVRISDGWLAAVCGAVIVGLVLCGHVFFGTYRMDWTVKAEYEKAETSSIRQELLSLGFPEYVLDDMTEEDILACDGAAEVVVDCRDHPVNDGRQVTTETEQGIYIDRVYDKSELRLTGVAVRLSKEREEWRIIHHFLWVEDAYFGGTESMQLWTADRNSQGWYSDGTVTGQVSCDLGDASLTAPYRFLGRKTFTASTIFWGKQTSTDIFAAFSMPKKSENQRGYVSYSIKICDPGWIVDSWVNYTHQQTWLQYPVITAMDARMKGLINNDRVFMTVQDALQFFSDKGKAEIIS